MPPTPKAPRTVHVVPHTHWDREWYRPFEAYRFRLVHTLDRVLAAELPYFLLDGQTIVLDDYLAIRPEQEELLRSRIGAGQLGAGPWYVLVDEFLVSGESLVRNLLVGRAGMARFGARDAVGYLPDMFGHIAQMPQLLRGFGLAHAVVWRGANPQASRFTWRSPDGSEVLAAWLPLGYYQTMFMEELPAEKRAAQLLAYVAAFEGTDGVLLLSGADHMAPRLDLSAQLQAVAGHTPALALALSPLHAALAGPPPAHVIEGELRDPAKAYLLPGVLSTRSYLKAANVACQTLLERYAEPACTLAWLNGRAYPAAFLAHAWKELMKNHPHDSICGCSVDQVHRDMLPRFEAVRQVADELIAEAIGGLVVPRAEPPVILFNPTGWPFAGWIELAIDWPLASAPAAVALVGPDGREAPQHLLGVEDTEVFCAEIDLNPDWHPVRRFRLAVEARLPALGSLRLEAAARDHFAPPQPHASARPQAMAGGPGIENEHLAVAVTEGRLVITDKASGAVFSDAIAYLDEADAGDSYNFSPLADGAVLRAGLQAARVVSVAPHQAVLELSHVLEAPVGLSQDRQRREGPTTPLAIVTTLTLAAGAKRLDFRVEFENTLQDHRLRLVTALGAGDRPVAWADGPFGVFERPVVAPTPLPVPKGSEAVMGEFPQGLFTALQRPAGGFALANEGTSEASLIETESGWALATTLVRAVGWLSRDDLATRGGGAGPRFPTPEAQCLGRQSFRFAFVPYAGTWQAIAPELHQWAAPPLARMGTGGLAAGLALGDARVVLSCLKRSEDGRAAVLRVYNPTPGGIEARLALGWPGAAIAASDLAETPGEALGTGAIAYQLRPYEIKTWRVSVAGTAPGSGSPFAETRQAPA